MTDFLIQEWPYTRALGERWIAFPMNVPAHDPWPGLKFFANKQEAEAHAATY